MTNFGSIAGGMLWMAVASLLMMAALEPVTVAGEAEAPVYALAQAGSPATPLAA
ncbi:MAG TPA: hypothetical protein VGD19_04330 [Allosphingosinicella sp.]|jgi:hypothetical protein